MSLKSKILNVLLENHINNESIEKHIESFLEQVQTDNSLHSTDYIIKWYEKKRAECTMKLTEIPVNELKGWHTDSQTGNIQHDSGEFFSIIGLDVGNTTREVSGWTQPIVYQKEMGVLGIICKKNKQSNSLSSTC